MLIRFFPALVAVIIFASVASSAQRCVRCVASPAAAPIERGSGPCSKLCTCGCVKGGACTCIELKPARVVVFPPPPPIPPVVHPLPAAPVEVGQAIPTGVDWDKIGDGYSRKGKWITRAEAFEAVTTGIPDDGGKLRLTVIGPDDARAKVERDLKFPENKDIADRVLLWSVKPDHFSVRDTGFVTTGNPTVYCQAPADGKEPGAKVIYRENDYQGVGDFQAIRKAIANYDAAKDPGRAPAVVPLSMPPMPLLVIGGVVLLIVYLNRKKVAS